ncbi:hypothetical protein ACHAW6_004943 [Cyclotella cf. meneghiniana]
MAATKRLAQERLGIERDPIPYITLVDDNSDGSNILQWKIVLELSPIHDSLDDPAVIGRASGSPYCKPIAKKNNKDRILAGMTDPGSAYPINRPAARAYFAFKFEFPANYPFKPPIATFLPNTYHPNIVTSTGMLKGEGWHPSLKVKNLFAQLRKFLCDLDPDDPLTSEIAPTLNLRQLHEDLKGQMNARRVHNHSTTPDCQRPHPESTALPKSRDNGHLAEGVLHHSAPPACPRPNAESVTHTIDTPRLLEGKRSRKTCDVNEGEITTLLNDTISKIEHLHSADNGEQHETKLTFVVAEVADINFRWVRESLTEQINVKKVVRHSAQPDRQRPHAKSTAPLLLDDLLLDDLLLDDLEMLDDLESLLSDSESLHFESNYVRSTALTFQREQLLTEAKKASEIEDGKKTKFLIDAVTKIEQLCSADNDEQYKTELASILADVFRSQVPTDWSHRAKLFKAALDLTLSLSSKQEFATLLGDPNDFNSVVYWLDDFGQQVEQIVKHESTTISNKTRNGDEFDIKFANRVIEVRDEAVKMTKQYNCKLEEGLAKISFQERYQVELGPMRFDTVESMDNHYFLKQIPNAPSTFNTRQVFKELAAYRNALPVEYRSSVFCRVINNRIDLLRVMITGPDGSPYSNGCFFFDINLPPSYPQVAPKVQFLTTAGGAIRFNPNLYNDGKVCLSLLGTWPGPGWISGVSTLLQVLISIQALVFVPDPFFNEPFREAFRGTSHDDVRSKQYNLKIRQYTIDAAIKSHLSSILSRNYEYSEFEGIMTKHFLEKRSLIEKEIQSWAKEDLRLESQPVRTREIR